MISLLYGRIGNRFKFLTVLTLFLASALILANPQSAKADSVTKYFACTDFVNVIPVKGSGGEFALTCFDYAALNEVSPTLAGARVITATCSKQGVVPSFSINNSIGGGQPRVVSCSSGDLRVVIDGAQSGGTSNGTTTVNQPSAGGPSGACSPGSGSFFGLPPWYKYLDGEIVAGKCSPKLDLADNPGQIAAILLAVAEMLLRVAAIVAVVFVIVGGVRYTTSQGEPDATAGARKTIINALIGLVLAVSAAAVVTFIGGRFR